MRYTDFYRKIYEVIGGETPIGVDCGQLCNGACCKGDDETGMYLFPGERHMYASDGGWFDIAKSGFCYKKGEREIPCDIFICKATCDRGKRPLACRIFPLLPYVDKQGKMSVIPDPRGRGLCPLTIMENSDLDGEFVRRVERVGKIMMKIPEMKDYLTSLSRLTDEFRI